MLERQRNNYESRERSSPMPTTNTTERAIAQLLRQGFTSDQQNWSILVQLAKSGVPISSPKSR
jgi:ribosomal protein S8